MPSTKKGAESLGISTVIVIVVLLLLIAVPLVIAF